MNDMNLDMVFGHLANRDLLCAIKEMEDYLLVHPHQVNSDRLYAIKADYQMMIDYWRKGFKDPQLPKLNDKLLHRMYELAANVATNAKVLKSPLLASLFMKVNMSTRDWAVSVIGEQLEAFVSDIALLELEPPHIVAERRKALHQQHFQLISEVFARILTSDLWTEGQGEEIEQLLLSPTIDSIDQQLIVSAMTLASVGCYDMVKFRTLIHVYQQATDEYVRQRALVGWVFAINNDLEEALYPEMRALVTQTLENPKCMKELVELQKQIFYCLGAEDDRHTIEQEILPDLIKNQQNITRTGFIEQDEESVLNDILHPNAEEENLERLESSFRRMVDMQKQGSDIYFGGFSQMKRFSFFNEISNWFIPFYMDHPGIAASREKFKKIKFLTNIMENGPFCDSDKYSFMLAFDVVLNQIPDNVRQMLDRGEAMMMHQVEKSEMSTPAYIRRIYLQDLFRFFRLHPVCNEFVSIFSKSGTYNTLFMRAPIFDDTDIQTHFMEVIRFLLKRKRKGDAQKLLDVISNEKLFDYDYYMLKGYLDSDSMEAYQKALELNPKSERALLALAKMHFKREEYSLALEAYGKLLELNPDKKSYQLNKAVCLTNLYRYDEAEQILYRLSFEDADDLNVTRVLAWALTGDGKYDQAGRLYEQLLEQAKPADTDRINYAFCLWFSNKIDEAASIFRAYLMKASPKGDRWSDLLQILDKERQLIEKKGITSEEMRMMIDWIDVYGL